MNAKRNPISSPAVQVGILILAVAAAFAVGLMVGRQGKAPASADGGGQPAAGPNGQPAPAGRQPRPQPQPNPGPSSADVAKSKGVPEVLEAPGGNFQLVAVVEGVEANQKLTQNLQLVGSQRQQLLLLSQRYDSLPANSVQQRELLAGEINSARQTLVRNLQYMAQNYGYSLQFNYQLVPHVAALYEILTSEDGVRSTELVHRFEDTKSYQDFQSLREEYILASVTEAKRVAAEKEKAGGGAETPAPAPAPGAGAEPGAGAAPGGTEGTAGTEEPAAAPAAEPAAEPEQMVPSPEMLELQDKLIAAYKFDPTKNYQINLEKTALYARPGNQ